MDEIDRKILNMIQDDFPLEEEPFRVIGERTGIGEEEVLARLGKLKESGVIRRIGAVFDPPKLGFVSTLCAARVPDDRLPEFVETVNSYREVTHNYRRDHEYNVWFTLIAPDRGDIDRIIREIQEKTGITDILDMPARRTFKINAKFDL
ncbi:MAG: AsnC family transcriptional regulator [Deltaproteobacteria bacterium]|nr:AsnC family transcriptional regulator [Deltaproteobacteria bacterium]